MAAFVDTHGLTLIAILGLDGWLDARHAKNVVLMTKKDHQSVNVHPKSIASTERVESVCRNAGIEADRFEELLNQLGVTSAAEPPPTIQ